MIAQTSDFLTSGSEENSLGMPDGMRGLDAMRDPSQPSPPMSPKGSESRLEMRDDLPDKEAIRTIVETMPESTDVVVIGAGPAGLALSCELARRNIDFLLFDVNARPVMQSRALMLHSRTLEILADLGLTEPAVLNGHILRGIHVSVGSRSVMDLKFAGLSTPFPFILVLEQSDLEQILIEWLEKHGHVVRRPLAVLKVEIPEDTQELRSLVPSATATPDMSVNMAAANALTRFAAGSNSNTNLDAGRTFGTMPSEVLGSAAFQFNQPCSVTINPIDLYGDRLDNMLRQVKCRFIAGCDGVKSSVRRCMGVNYKPYGRSLEYLMADLNVTWGMEMQPDRLHVIQGNDGVLLVIPMAQERWRVTCLRPSSGEGPVEPFQRLKTPETSEVQQILQQLVPGTSVIGSYWISAFICCSFICDSFHRSNAFLCGDSAHCHTPTFGQGMNTGIQDAYNLGWKLATVIQGGAPQLLDSYTAERVQVAHEVVRLSHTVLESFLNPGMAFRCMLSTLGPLIGGCEFFVSNIAKIISQVDLRYSPSSVVGHNMLTRWSVSPGSRVPSASIVALPFASDQPKNSETPRALVDFLRGGQHTLLLFVHVLPSGTKARNLLGCERAEEATRWSADCMHKLARNARLLAEIFRGRESIDGCLGDLRVVWILCGLVDLRSPSNTVSFGQIQDHVPQRLIYFFVQGFRSGFHHTVAVDYENGVYRTLGLRLADPDGAEASDKSGAFVLVRPDGHIACNGYAGDSTAAGFALDYTLNMLSTAY